MSKNFFNYFYILLLSIIILLLITYFKAYYLIILLIFILFIIYKINKKLLIINILIIIIVITNLLIFSTVSKKRINKEINHLTILKITKKTDYYQLIVKDNNQLFINKYVLNLNTELDLNCGDELSIQGTIKEASSNHNEAGFNYQEYLKQQNIVGIVELSNNEVEVVNHHLSIHQIHYLLTKYIDNNYDKDVSFYLKALVIGEKDNTNSINDKIRNIGISHLFVVSGMHVSIIVSVLSFLFKRLKIKKQISEIVGIIFVIVYLIINDFSISILRVSLSLIYHKFLIKYFKDNLNIFTLNVITISLFNPRICYSYSFLLSYLISFSLIIGQLILKRIPKIFQGLFISVNALAYTIPIVAGMTGYFNLLLVINNLFMVPIVSFLILPLSIITLLIQPLSFIYHYVIIGFEYLINLLNKIPLFIIIPKLPLLLIILYYIVIFLIFYLIEVKFKIKKIKLILSITIFIITLILCFNIKSLNNNYEITFFNAGAGEATLIKCPLNQCNILIDTSSDKELVTYLTKQGVSKLDYVFISHSDSDHNGIIYDIASIIRVKNLIINPYDEVTIDLLKDLKYHINIYRLKAYEYLNTNYFNIYNLNPIKNYNKSNLNSLCFIMTIDNLKIMFTGDIEKEVEEVIFKNKYIVDIIKIPHHGSNTSSSNCLLDNVQTDIAIGMNGYNNKYHFPNSIVINRYLDKSIKVYNTIRDGMIKIIKNKGNDDLKIIILSSA